jgi:hypothetical protein
MSGLMRRAIEEVRAARGEGVVVSITYTDRPSNDFSALFELLHDAANEASPLHNSSDVYVFACGTRAHSTLLSRCTVRLPSMN